MTTVSQLLGLVATLALCSGAHGEFRAKPDARVTGRGEGRFEIGPLLAQDDFADLSSWVVQIEDAKGLAPAHVEARDGTLDCLLPGRGCTVWFRRKLDTRVTITYDVVCPAPEPAVEGVRPTDINNFWMASDPSDPDQGLFDASRYTGDFGSYGKIHGYYASTGGGRNTTTRMRRYPREVDGRPAPHLALKDKDGRQEFLITPGKVMTVQLVAFDDLVQYLVDGRLVYEVAGGDRTGLERIDGSGKRLTEEVEYDLERFPVYRSGYFGFRMVGTHHIYSKFRVYALEPVAGRDQGRKKVGVSTLEELRDAMAASHQHVVMKPGTYEVRDMHGHPMAFHMSGSDNFLDLSGVTIRMPIRTLSQMVSGGAGQRGRGGRRDSGSYVLSGDRITLKGGTFVNTYPGERTEVTRFGAYNRNPDNYPAGGVTEMRIRGDDIRVIGCRMIVRGSYPYGYGNIYGIGGGAVVGLRKHCGIQITGQRAIIDGCDLKMEAFGHAIYVQSGADQTVVRNTRVEGAVRPSNDFYTETHDDDLAKRFDYRIQWPESVAGLPVPRDHMINLCEDGIRAYGDTGEITVENCEVSKTRGGIKLYMAKRASISDCMVTDCVVQGYSLPSGGTLTRSSGNAAYGPLLYVHMDSHSSQKIDLEVLPSPHGLGDHPLAAIKGRGHRITFTTPDATPPAILRPIIVGYPLRFDYLSVEYPEVPKGMEGHFAKYAPDSYKAAEITLDNRTPHPVVVGALARDNHITSRGAVRDDGINTTTR